MVNPKQCKSTVYYMPKSYGKIGTLQPNEHLWQKLFSWCSTNVEIEVGIYFIGLNERRTDKSSTEVSHEWCMTILLRSGDEFRGFF